MISCGMKVPEPRGPGGFLSRSFRKLICAILQCVMNPRIKAIVANDGVSPKTVDAKITMSPNGWVAIIDLTAAGAGGGGGGGYMGTYDNTKSYSSGQTVRVATPATIAGVSVPAGYYGLPPGFSVPANGTGNQIPQYPEPTSGTVYWHALVVYCQ